VAEVFGADLTDPLVVLVLVIYQRGPRGDGSHFVSLDKAIATMRATGRDMHDKYKETSRGGLAATVIEC